MRNKISVGVVVASLTLALAGCGNTPGQRAVSGGLLGAGAGAAIGAATGGHAGTGALIGGAAGAAGGALTAPR
jgi:osmotically inducible lipoprotein OsmB